ncbi:group III truncated hemoglobin [Psychroflexus aestuariivivens]|uniref:group III truncated hemoglobin n=1 Tax=Psychroflexus aestuariivivens TaxID=1795040 RepID=UPI000FD7D085|nr:group III truncated hemoglobin [Psychroflexus aestuariivivens]
MEDIESREDVRILVEKFYEKIRQNDEIGHFFNETITDWEAHLEKLTDFWESNLFFKSTFTGNPKRAHIKVDQAFGEKITNYHFGIWMNLWFETIDELYSGEIAHRAKTNARKMSVHLFLGIYKARSK